MNADERRCSDSKPRIFTDDTDESPLLLFVLSSVYISVHLWLMFYPRRQRKLALRLSAA
jgi:hypothetical protein